MYKAKSRAVVGCEGEKGASLVEYGLLVALIAIVCIAAIKILGGSVSASFSDTASAISGGIAG